MQRCHPAYLTPKAHVKLSSPGAFDGLRIHTDEINEVINRITPRSLTIAVVSLPAPLSPLSPYPSPKTPF